MKMSKKTATTESKKPEKQIVFKPDVLKKLSRRLKNIAKDGATKVLDNQDLADVDAASKIVEYVFNTCNIGEFQVVRHGNTDTSLHNPELKKCIVSLCYESIIAATPDAKE